jgi:dTDP-4-amino-4,6-dideoxygalactose transaminase
MMSSYKGRALGTIGHLGTFSFHETKNYTSGGEGGLLIINDEKFKERAEVIREKGTNRSQFFRGMVDKYQWMDVGSSYLPSELQAAYLWGQLKCVDEIKKNRLDIWHRYWRRLHYLNEARKVELQQVPLECEQNAHMFYLKVKDLDERSAIINYLSLKGIIAAFHYVPLHSSLAGRQFGVFSGEDVFTSQESERLVRLPLFFSMTESSVSEIISAVSEYYS